MCATGRADGAPLRQLLVFGGAQLFVWRPGPEAATAVTYFRRLQVRAASCPCPRAPPPSRPSPFAGEQITVHNDPLAGGGPLPPLACSVVSSVAGEVHRISTAAGERNSSVSRGVCLGVSCALRWFELRCVARFAIKPTNKHAGCLGTLSLASDSGFSD